MTNKEFFLAICEDEAPRFRRALEVMTEDKLAYKVHERSREAGELAYLLAYQPKYISGIIKDGAPDGSGSKPEKIAGEKLVAMFNANYDKLKQDVAAISDQDWENQDATAGDWTVKKYWMAWAFLTDAIHHRGQLTTFLRAMGAKVPSVYGPTAEDSNG
jgi:uncharacterized damage-inducible protein DinB